MKYKHPEKAGADQFGIIVLRSVQEMEYSEQKKAEEKDKEKGSEESPFFSDDGKDKVCALLGDESGMALGALQVPFAKKPSRTYGGHGLDDVPARALGINIGIQEYHKTHELVLFQYLASAEGQEDRGIEYAEKVGQPKIISFFEGEPAPERQAEYEEKEDCPQEKDNFTLECQFDNISRGKKILSRQGEYHEEEGGCDGKHEEKRVSKIKFSDEQHGEQNREKDQGGSKIRLGEDEENRKANDCSAAQ
jgi:hypothetical protein